MDDKGTSVEWDKKILGEGKQKNFLSANKARLHSKKT